MSIRLAELLAKVPPEVEKRVKDASDDARRSLQDAMRLLPWSVHRAGG